MRQIQPYENILMALETIRGHKLRSLLTILGVIAGVATVIVIASILTGMRNSIISMVEEFGTNTIYAFHLSTGPSLGPRDRIEWQRKPLTVEDAAALQEQGEAIEDVSYHGFSWGMDRTLQYRGETYRQAEILGVPANYMQVTGPILEEGRFITPSDDLRRNQICILGSSVVEALFPHQSQVLGQVIQFSGQRFTVVGLAEKRESSLFGSWNQMIYIPYRTLRKLNPRSEPLVIIVKAKQNQLAKAWNEAEAVLRRQRGVRFNEANNFDLTTSDRVIEQFDAITASAGLIAIAISGVGLLVGGIGVMNIMLVSVTERTREIGVRKAVGARRRDIVLQFLFEAITLTTIGGIIGVVLSILSSYVIIWWLPDLPAVIPAWAVAAGLLVSMTVGLIFGVWPALKAARLDPIESLRYE
ncbi:MAG: ABC transporter permease [Acidobacteriota bacterium]